MNITSTGIAIALALIIVIGVFVFGYPLFRHAPSAEQTTQTSAPAASAAGASATPAVSGDLNNVTSLEARDDVVGAGAVAQAGDSVTVDYVGALANGTVFDASKNHGSQGFTFTLGAGQVIKGWDEGVAGMKVGGTRTLVIPASLGYGAQGAGGLIPPNATLVFQVTLRSVNGAKR